MKFNYKKIASVLASTIMLGSTVAFAGAAWPAPLVNNGVGDAAIVYGDTAAATDMAAAVNLGSELDKSVTATSGTTASGGDTKELSKDNVKINLGDALNSVYLSLDQDELSKVLADGLYEDADGTEYDYEQSITLGVTNLTHFASDEVNADENPVIGFNIADSVNILNYTMDFTDTPLNSSAVMKDTFLEMLGVNYYISAITTTGSQPALTLLDSANTATVDSSGPKTVVVSDKTYEVEIVTASEGTTTNKATLKVNGVQIDSTNQGSSRKIDTNTYLSIVDVNEASRESDLHYVKFSIGSGKAVLTNGAALELNDKSVEGVDVVVSATSAGKLDQIQLVWTADQESFLVPGKDLTLPGLESIKLSMPEFAYAATEDMSVANSGDDYMLLRDVVVKDGKITLPILYSNASKTGFSGLGKDATHMLAVNASGDSLALDESRDSYFVASRATGDDFESYVFEFIGVNEVDAGAHNETTIKNMANDKEYVFTDSDDIDFGDITLTTTSANGDLGTVGIAITGTNVYADRIFTAAGMGIRLPSMNATGLGGNIINSSGVTTSWIMNITEGDKDNNVDITSTTVTLAHTSANGPQVSAIGLTNDLAVESGSDNKQGYVISPRATKMLYKTGGDQDTLDIMYPKSESYAKVYVSESAVSFSGSNSIKVVKDTEVDSVSSKNLIVVGGSCINTVAATLLGSSTPLCGDAFGAKTKANTAGSYLIKTFASPYNTAKIAILVAGYDAAGTTAAATMVINDGTSVSTTVETGDGTVGPAAN